MQSQGKIFAERSTGFETSEDEQIYHEVCGKGEHVVLCHGAGGNHALWYQQVPALVSQYRVIVWDQRGFGRSTNHTEKSGPQAAVRDLGALLDSLDVERAHLVGQSMGGWAILGYALEHPDRVLSLTLADTLGGIQLPDGSDDTNEARTRVADALLNENLPIGFDHPCLAPDFKNREPARAFLFLQFSSLGPPTPLSALLGLMEVSYSSEQIKTLSVPVLFIVGSLDPLFPVADIYRAAELIPYAQVVEIAGCGHSPYFEDAGRWNQVLLDFLKQ